jgi:hypothetical protein
MFRTLVIGFMTLLGGPASDAVVTTGQPPPSQQPAREQAQEHPTSGRQSLLMRPSTTDPFGNLFMTRVDRLDAKIRSQGANPPAPNPRIICGLTVWQVDPAIDPGIRVEAPDRGVDFKIRRIVPETCRQ